MSVKMVFARACSAILGAPGADATKTTPCVHAVLEEIALRGVRQDQCARVEIVISVVRITRIVMAVAVNKKTLSDHNAPFEPTALEIVI